MENKAIIIGGEHHNTLGVVKSLGKKGVKLTVCIIAGESFSIVLKSKYVNKGLIFKSDSLCVDYLIKQANNVTKRIPIICCSDSIVAAIDERYDELKCKYVLPLCSNKGLTSFYMDKETIVKTASDFGIKIPRSWKLLGNKIPDGIIYPCITKPLQSIHGSKQDIIVCKNREELENVLTRHSECSEYLVQEYIEREKEISILGAVLENRQDVVFSGCIDKLREYGRGTSAFAVMLDNSIIGDVKDKLRKLLVHTTYSGLFSAEFLLYKGDLYFLEINFRNDGNGYVPTCAGLNLPYIWFLSATEQKIEDTFLPLYPCFFMLEICDIKNMLTKKVSLIQWIKDLKKVKCFYYYDKEDWKPFIYAQYYIFIRPIINRIVRICKK